VSSGDWSAEFPLEGPAGEPIDLARVFRSHGIASLPPMRLDQRTGTFEITVPLPIGGARTIRISPGRAGHGLVTVAGVRPDRRTGDEIMAQVRHLLSLDLDLSPFYAVAKTDPDLEWATAGAGRMVRSPTVFEDVVKTICTTNTSWGGTTRMVNALVEHLGAKAPDAPAGGPYGHTFPTPAAMAAAPEAFYKTVAGAGYRAGYLRQLAASVAAEEVDLEALTQPSAAALSDEEVENRLRVLPGVGPYAAAHIMLMLGRYSRLILDSWTRPTYARLAGRSRPATDGMIVRRFRRYGPYAGLAFWLFVTHGWVEDAPGGG
jgi:N-glycosylase/DNA lyase